jgi:hypothetical protein
VRVSLVTPRATQLTFGAVTALASATLAIVVSYAGTEPVSRLVTWEAIVFVGASTALFVLWLALAVSALVFWISQPRHVGLCFGVILVSLIGMWVSTWSPKDYLETLQREPRYSCPRLK